MLKTYDVVMIGAGPTAVAALSNLPKGLKIAVLTGKGAANVNKSSNLHSKIKTEALIRDEIAGVAQEQNFAPPAEGMLFNTAAIGGLANYWGQQFTRYDVNDPWPIQTFQTYEDYLNSCSSVEQLFTLSSSIEEHETVNHIGKYLLRSPSLLTGTRTDPSAGLFSMRNVFSELVEDLQATQYDEQALKLEHAPLSTKVYLSNGQKISGKHVFMAAGVIGSLRLALASSSDLKSVRLSDHAPYMYYYFDKSKVFKGMGNDSIEHFNYLSIEHNKSSQTKLFASLYHMSKSSIALILAAMGLPPLFPKRHPPKIVDSISPIQVWTETSKMTYLIERERSRPKLLGRAVSVSDEEVIEFEKCITRYGKILHRSSTQPGSGFHFHAGEVSLDGSNFQSLSSFIEDRFENRVSCIDASVLNQIGARPHSLTAMAIAHKKVEQIMLCKENYFGE